MSASPPAAALRAIRGSAALAAWIFFVATTGAQDAVTAVQPAGRNAPATPPAVVAPVPPAVPPTENGGSRIRPTWETQKEARTFLLGIPAPRGQITDRHGNPLAQTRVGYNLALQFPCPPLEDANAILAFARTQIRLAESLTGRTIPLTDDFILRYHENRGRLPLELVQDLLPETIARVQARNHEHLKLVPVYLRFYPNGSLAAHVIGYPGRTGRTLTTPIQNNDLLWPDYEGREGIEQVFNAQLTGKPGQLNIAFDAAGRKATEKITIPPQPGHNVILAIDEEIQRLCETTLAKNCSRGALVVLDPTNGDVLALASWPTFNPNLFVPFISREEFARVQNDPAVPLLPRAYRSAYPPGSTFKVVVGLAALQSGVISPDDTFGCPPAFSLGNLVFRNWKKTHAGELNFVEAITQSCNTWFYQVGLKLGAANLIDWATRAGLGEPTGILLPDEAAGRIPTDEYMLRTHKRKILQGDLVNMSIGQSDILITPLQMAAVLAAVGNGGTLLQPRLVLQVQTYDNKIVAGYDARVKEYLTMSDSTRRALRQGLTNVVHSPSGTAGKAAVKGIKVAGKTGTAQWGPKRNERTAAWFAGFAPADNPRFAFAALYEGAPNDSDVHGGSHAAPMIGQVLRELFKKEAAARKAAAQEEESETATDQEPEPSGAEAQQPDQE